MKQYREFWFSFTFCEPENFLLFTKFWNSNPCLKIRVESIIKNIHID